jgi:hypothetical protein
MPDPLPTKEATLSLMQLAERTPEAAEYLYNRFKKILNGQLPEVLVAMKSFWESVVNQFTSTANPMAGQSVATPAENLERAVAAPEPNPIPPGAKQISLHIQIGDNSRMERGYLVNNKRLKDPETMGYLDGLMKRWIAKSKLVREGHIMYDVPERKDEFGKRIPISPEQLKEKFEHPTEGIKPFIREASGGKCDISALNIERIATSPAPQSPQASTKMGG